MQVYSIHIHQSAPPSPLALIDKLTALCDNDPITDSQRSIAMNRKYISLVLALMLVLSLFTGCDAVGQIAGSVADAAMAELETQIRAILEEYKMDVIELKTTAGKLNDGEGDIQFFCAVLVRADNDAVPRSCADALGKVFQNSGIMPQTSRSIESPFLVNKTLDYSYTGFGGEENLYTIYVYSSVEPSRMLEGLKNK